MPPPRSDILQEIRDKWYSILSLFGNTIRDSGSKLLTCIILQKVDGKCMGNDGIEDLKTSHRSNIAKWMVGNMETIMQDSQVHTECRTHRFILNAGLAGPY